MPPIYMALGAAVLWGIYYVVTAKVVPNFPPHLILFVDSIIVAVLAALSLYFWPVETSVYKSVFGPNFKMLAMVGVISFAASFMIIASLGGMNATMAALIEISYPIFIIAFAWLLFGENHLSIPTAVGGVLILAGVAVISIYGESEEHAAEAALEKPAIVALGVSMPQASEIVVGIPAPHVANATAALKVKVPADLVALHPTGSMLEVTQAA